MRAENVLYIVKIITKPVIWNETKNPYVDVLACPMCGKVGARLDPAIVLTDGPSQRHVNLANAEGKLLTIRGNCPNCQATFLLRILLHEAGAYTWHDIGVTAKTWNELLSEGSKDQLPCMCQKCQQQGAVVPDSDESTAPASLTTGFAKLKAACKKPSKEEIVDAEVVEDEVVSGQTVTVLQQQGYALTLGQHRAIARAMKADWAKLAKDTGLSVKDTQLHFVSVIEAYVRIKFATFQPSSADDPTLPPKFPTVVPKLLFVGFKQSGEDYLCQYLIASFAMVDQVLGRPDLPASVIYHHMCRMCKLTDCKFHPSKRGEG